MKHGQGNAADNDQRFSFFAVLDNEAS